eukprot:UN07376
MIDLTCVLLVETSVHHARVCAVCFSVCVASVCVCCVLVRVCSCDR